MYFPALESIVSEPTLPLQLVDQFDTWLASIPAVERDSLTATAVAEDLDIPVAIAGDLFALAVNLGILRVRLVVMCPECSEVLSEVERVAALPPFDQVLQCPYGHEFALAEAPEAVRVYFTMIQRPDRYAKKKPLGLTAYSPLPFHP